MGAGPVVLGTCEVKQNGFAVETRWRNWGVWVVGVSPWRPSLVSLSSAQKGGGSVAVLRGSAPPLQPMIHTLHSVGNIGAARRTVQGRSRCDDEGWRLNSLT